MAVVRPDPATSWNHCPRRSPAPHTQILVLPWMRIWSDPAANCGPMSRKLVLFPITDHWSQREDSRKAFVDEIQREIEAREMQKGDFWSSRAWGDDTEPERSTSIGLCAGSCFFLAWIVRTNNDEHVRLTGCSDASLLRCAAPDWPTDSAFPHAKIPRNNFG